MHFCGTYRYATREGLERALVAARACLDDDVGDLEDAWMRCFVTRGNVLTVNVSMPFVADQRFAAAAVFDTLAQTAVEGAVEARHGAARVDLFASGGDE